MPIKPEEAVEVFGLDLSKYDDVDTLKSFVDSTWVKRANAKDDPELRTEVLGKVNRVARTRLSGIAKEYGLEMDSKMLTEGDPVDIIPEIGKALKTKFGEIDELRAKAEKAVPDDVLNDIKGKLKAAEKERDTFKTQATEFQQNYDKLTGEIKQTKAKAVEDSEWNAALSGIQFHQGVDDLKKAGFLAVSKSKYRIELDDDFKPKLVDAKGSPIKHPKKGGEFLTLSEALKLDAKEMKLEGVNPHAGKPVPAGAKPQPMRMGETQPDPNRKQRYIAPPMM